MSTYHKDHPHYQALEEVLKLHLERYGEPWEKRGPLIQDILNTLFREPYNMVDWREEEPRKIREEWDKRNAIDHGVDVIGDEKD